MLTPRQMEWENGNEFSMFPIAADSSPVADSGIALPNGIIADLSVYLARHHTASDVELQLSCVRVSPSIVTATISSYEISSGVATNRRGVLAVAIPRDEFEPYRPYAMDPMVDGAGGVISFGDIDWPEQPQMYTFRTEDEGVPRGRLDPSVCHFFTAPSITKFIDDSSGASLSGIVTLNLPDTVEAAIAKTDTGYMVALSLTQTGNEMLATVCNSGTSATACGTPIVKTINGVEPNDLGEILVVFA